MTEQEFGRVAKQLILAFVGVFVVITASCGGCYTVDQRERAVVTRFGAVTSVAGPGMHWKVPIVDSVTKLPTVTDHIEWLAGFDGDKKPFDSRMESYSKDRQPAHISVKITWHLKTDPDSIRLVFSQYGDANGYEERVLVPKAYEAVKIVFGTFDAVNVIQNRGAFIAEVDGLYRKLVGIESPAVIEAVQIQDIGFSKAYEQAIEERMRAEVEVQKVAQNLERERKSAEIAVVQARAKADAVRLAGEAEAAAIRARGDALRDNPRLPELVIAEKWDGKLPTTMVPGGSVPLLPVK